MTEYCECDVDQMCTMHLEKYDLNPPYYDEWLATKAVAA